MFYCGIDPGGDGGVAILDEQGKVVRLFVYNNVQFASVLSNFIGEDMKICIEDVHPIQGARAGSTFVFGLNTGRAHGVVATYLTWTNQPIENFSKVDPKVWKRGVDCLLGDDAPYEKRKLRDIERAHELFPDVDIRCKFQFKRDSNGNYVKVKKQISKNKFKMVREKELVDHDGLADALLIAEWLRRKEQND